VKRHSYIVYIEAGVDLVGLPGCRRSYAFPRTMSNGTNMFFPGPSLELLHLYSRRSPELRFS
jgi:hypothetical protein